jgi:transposase, IS6 family
VAETDLFKWRHYESEIILLCVRWYLRYALSYRDLEEMMEERNLTVDHTTIHRSRSGVCSGVGEKNSSSLETDE